jgi:hypothetical protein
MKKMDWPPPPPRGIVSVWSDVVIVPEETEMLNLDAPLVHMPWGLNQQMGYFFTHNFFVHVAQEMREVDNNQLQLLMNEFGKEYLK